MSDQWDIKRVLDWTRGFLSEKGCENAKASAEWLIGAATGLSRLELYTNFERPLSPEELALLHGYVKRRAMGEPLQYISGTAAFRHITLHVRKGVLIPRPETEVLVSELLAELPPPERARAFDSSINEYGEQLIDDMQGADMADPVDRLRALPEERSTILVADLCTGSGCIACSLAYEHPDIEAIATDISPDALSLAQENAAALGLSERVAVIESDLGSGISDEHMGRFDAVVSNPPYVPTAVMSSLPREVSDFEPRLALDGGEDGLNFFRAIARWSLDALKPGGVLAVELYEDCLNEAQAYAASIGFASTRIADDLAGKPRVLIARAPHAHDGQQ